ncbi:MAG: S46 family peptidase [Pyrinomonadaceae bacterium]
MISKTNRFISAAFVFAVLFVSVPAALAFDEGMYAPDQLSRVPLDKKGIKIKASDIYNPAGGGLTDAVIRLSVGCTAEFVSPEGLILTNHHCGFDALVKASTPEKDLIETGFKTESRAGEIPAQGYSIFVTNRVEDVTAKIMAGTEGMSGAGLATAAAKHMEELTASEQAKARPGSTVRIQALNSGYFYYLYETMQVKDVRVVYAPPRNIGIFGGDPDNFEWTRHTGDFTFLRAYTAPDGSSADYSTSNVPMKPRKFLTVNIGGIKENDAVFVLGYPGGTTRYRESWSMLYARDANFPFLERWLTALSDSLRTIGSTNDEKRISFQSDIASFDNSRKAFGGGHLQLKRVKAVEQRREDEARMATWIAANPERQKRYGNVLADLKSLSEESNAAQMRDVLMRRFPDPNSSVVFGNIVAAMAATGPGSKPQTDAERAAKLKQIEELYKEREPIFEADLLKFAFREFENLPEGQKFKPAEDLFGSLKGRARRDAEAKFIETIVNGEYSAPAKVIGLYGPRTMEFIEEREKILTFARGVVEEQKALIARGAKFNASINGLRTLYMQALTEMKGMTVVYPDANSSLRFSHGYIKGYQSREAEMRTPFTTIKGMIEKDTGEKPFDVPRKIFDLQNAKDFGRYGEGDSVVVNFLSTTDIIGGNSGSPILNANGEQIGLCFDGNFEGLGNDFYYDTDKNRTISVDIRFVLFVTEKFGGAKWVVDEMKLVGKR